MIKPILFAMTVCMFSGYVWGEEKENRVDTKEVVRKADNAAAKDGKTSAITMTDAEVVKHLGAYKRHFLSSKIPSGYELGEENLIKARPIAQMIAAYERRDPVIEDLGGSFALLCKKIDAKSFFPIFKADLTNADAKVRGVACDSLGYLGLKEAIPLLKNLLSDHAVIPGYSGDYRVNNAAKSALEQLGSTDHQDKLPPQAK